MAGKRNYEWPLATEWDAAAFLTQDKSGGVTQRVSPALVETKLEADGFPKIPSPSANEVAVYGVGGWDSVKLADANIDAAAAIGWGKISKTGAVASDVGALPDASPTIASGKLTTSASTTSGASLNVPNGAAPTSPAVGDIWADASRIFMQGRALAVTKGASNSFGSGSAFSVLDAASPTKGAHIQLNAAGGMDVWTLQGGSWIKELTLPIDGSIQLENLAGTGTRSVAVDSAGKLVIGSPRSSSVSSGAGVSGAETTVFTIGYLYGDSEIVLRGDSHATATGQIVRIRDNGNLLASFSIPAYKNFTIKAFIYNGGLRSECAIGEDGLSANVVLKSFGNSFTLTNTLTITTASDSLPPFVQSVTVR